MIPPVGELLDRATPVMSVGVLEVRAPQGACSQLASDVQYLVTRTARQLGAPLGLDELGRYVLLLPDGEDAPLEALLRQIGQLEVAQDRYAVRLAAGAGIVPLAGVTPQEALVEAAGLASASISERAQRPFRPLGARPWGPLRRWYFGLSAAAKAWTLGGLNLALAWLLPLAVYLGVRDAIGVDVTTVLFWMVFGAVIITAGTVYAELVLALRPDPPPPVEPAPYPAASAIVAAYLPNEAEHIVDTITCLLSQDYPGSFEVILAYNTPGELPVEEDLARLAADDRRLILLRVGDSSSKAQNVNAALQVAGGEFVGVFDADHRPALDAFQRAARWIAGGADVVQGRSVVRNGPTSRLARMIAVEFEGIYAVNHPGRATFHGFGIFGGSNGFWRTEVLDELRMRPDMLTEDIDVSMRAVLDGRRLVVDPGLVSRELAPETPMAVWSQRIRWSQGWYQVSLRHLGRMWRSPRLSLRQRLGAVFLLGWREVYAWLAAQMVPILLFSLLVRRGIQIQFIWPLFVLLTIYVTAVGPLQAMFAWYLALPELRRRWWWWVQYTVVTGTLFGEFKAHVNRAAHIREAIGDRKWQVTPRGAPPVAVGRTDSRPSAIVTMGPTPGTLDSVALDLPLPRVARRTLDRV